MNILLLLWTLVIFADGHRHKNRDGSIVETRFGKIQGSFMTSRLGRRIYSFRGVRYAEPPIGSLRFKQAVPVKPWKKVFDARNEGPACSQPRWPPMQNQSISEDCLRLNIYTTKLKTSKHQKLRPVIVFFHPSSFQVFSGQSFLYGPEYLLDQDIVLVTTNYRLAVLGLLGTGKSDAPDNLALKDQVEVLRFVRKTIDVFGGDPNSVTIAGDSAGAWSVALHMLSPMSKGFFHRAIAMSGTPVGHYQLRHYQKEIAEKQARFVGCPTGSRQEIIDCLKNVPAENISDSQPQFYEGHRTSIELWAPVVEKEMDAGEVFLPAQPYDLIKQGNFTKVPLIIGVTRDEISGVIISYVNQAKENNTAVFDDYNANWTTLMPKIFLYECNSPRSLNISETFRQFYLGGKPITLSNTKGLGEMFSDSLIFSTHRFAYLMAEYSDQPVYYYKFSFEGDKSWYTWSDKKPFGVSHMDDLLYLFNTSSVFDGYNPDAKIIEKMTSIWSSFASTAQPIPKNDSNFNGVIWTPLTEENQAYLDINEMLAMKKGLYSKRMKVWENLFPLKGLSET